MKRAWMWCLISLLSVGSAAWSQAQTTGATEKAVAALEQKWLQSQKTNNPDLAVPARVNDPETHPLGVY
jgi:hypothetical protein